MLDGFCQLHIHHVFFMRVMKLITMINDDECVASDDYDDGVKSCDTST